jgi:ABC-type methionine transport system permease subunit
MLAVRAALLSFINNRIVFKTLSPIVNSFRKLAFVVFIGCTAPDENSSEKSSYQT